MKTSRASKLKELSMPKKPSGEQEADMDLSMLEGSPEEEAAETPEEEATEAPEEDMAPDTLEHVSDDELLGELKKRGLMSANSPLGKAAESDLVAKMDKEEATETPEDEAAESEEEQNLEELLGTEKHPKLAAKLRKKK